MRLDTPSKVPKTCSPMYFIPSTPVTKPTRFAVSIISTFPTPPTAQTCRYQDLLPNCPSLSARIYRLGASVAHFCRWEKISSGNFRHDEQAHEPTPSKQPERQVVPKCDESEHQNGCQESILGPTERDVDVSSGASAMNVLGRRPRLASRSTG